MSTLTIIGIAVAVVGFIMFIIGAIAAVRTLSFGWQLVMNIGVLLLWCGATIQIAALLH